MTCIACSLFVDRPDAITDALDSAHQAVESGAALIEWRIDRLAQEPGAAAAACALVQRSPVPCIVTCRPEWEGGGYKGSDTDRVELLGQLIVAEDPPRYLDIELSTLERDPALAPMIGRWVADQPAGQRTGIILSMHDFSGRPANLWQRIESMTRMEIGDVIKLAWRARSVRDNLEAFDLLAARPRPMIALCMGPYGLLSRVLAGKFGGLLTFASLDAATAPGQPTVGMLRQTYRFADIAEDTGLYGVIGWPVEHSRGPALHNAGFVCTDHRGVYLPLPVPPEYEHFKATVSSLLHQPGLDFAGASVTIPHKLNLLRFVEEVGGTVDPQCRRIGAGNTLIRRKDGELAVINTDAPAAIDTLCAGMGIEREGLRGRSVAVLGAGGVARAVIVGLLDAGAEPTVFNRTPERGRVLVADLTGRQAAGDTPVPLRDGGAGPLRCAAFDVLINCTSIGMSGGPAPDDDPLSAFGADPRDLSGTTTVFDTVYTPTRTPFIQAADAAGATVVTGEAMFLRQAALQFEAWVGRPAPPEVYG